MVFYMAYIFYIGSKICATFALRACFTTVAIQNSNGFSDSHVCENTSILTNALILAVINSSLVWERESAAIN